MTAADVTDRMVSGSAERIETIWSEIGGTGEAWVIAEKTTAAPGYLPFPAEVRALYAAAAAEPPLGEEASTAELFADVYEVSVKHGQVLAAFSRATRVRPSEGTALTSRTQILPGAGRLRSFAYGHFWSWSEQTYPWALELRTRLGEAAEIIDGTFALNLLARDPRLRAAGLGRRTLLAWLDQIGGYGCWLQTDDIDSPARRLYDNLGFTEIGHGPDAPNESPGLVMYRTGQG